MSKIIVERDCDDSDMRELPPVLPMDLSSMSSRSFSLVLIQHSTRLKNKFSDEEFELVDKQFSRLKIAVRENLELKNRLKLLDKIKDTQTFNNCWSPLGNDFDHLKQFCGGIASVLPGTSSVESDFSIINWTKDPHAMSLTDFSLESILHCKQHKSLKSLCERNK